jgi:hypothetical protein
VRFTNAVELPDSPLVTEHAALVSAAHDTAHTGAHQDDNDADDDDDDDRAVFAEEVEDDSDESEEPLAPPPVVAPVRDVAAVCARGDVACMVRRYRSDWCLVMTRTKLRSTTMTTTLIDVCRIRTSSPCSKLAVLMGMTMTTMTMAIRAIARVTATTMSSSTVSTAAARAMRGAQAARTTTTTNSIVMRQTPKI